MSCSCRNALCVSTVLGLGLLLPVPAPAADAQGATQLEEIVVTARRVEERVQTVPISIAVYSQAKLAAASVSNEEDLARIVPGLSVNTQFGSEASALSLRGFYQDIGTNPTVAVYFDDAIGPRGGIGGAETHAGEGAGPGAFFDLQNVQVLKGPQGTLFGRNTTGGAILLVPNKPTPEFGGYVEVSFGNYDMKQVQAVVNVPVGEKVRLRFGVDHQERDGYLNNISGVGPAHFGDIDYLSLRGSAIVDITDDIENYTVATYSRSHNNGPESQVFGCVPGGGGSAFTALVGQMACVQTAKDKAAGPYTVENLEDNPESLVRTWQIINTTTWSVNDDLTVKNTASYAEWTSILDSSLFGYNGTLPAVFNIPVGGSFIPLPTSFLQGFGGPAPGTPHLSFTNTGAGLNGIPTTQQSTVTEELQVRGEAFSDRLRWQAGVYVESSQPLGEGATESHTFLPCTNVAQLQCTDVFGQFFGALSGLGAGRPLPPGTVQIGSAGPQSGQLDWHDYAAYGQFTYSLLDNLKFTGGVRFTDDNEYGHITRFTYYFPTPNNPAAPVCTSQGQAGITPAEGCFQSFHTSSRAPTFLVDLEYVPFEDVNTYAKYARGYRAGGIAPAAAPGFFTYRSEQVDSYEVGLKSQFRGDVPAIINVAGFYNNFTDQQVPGALLSATAAQASGIVNAGTSLIYGAEFEATVSPYKGLVLDANYTYLYSEITQIANFSVAPGSLYFFSALVNLGSELDYSPRHKLSVSADYTLPLPEEIGKVTLSLTYNYTGRQLDSSSAPVPFQYVPSSQIVNMNVSWDSIYGSPLDANFFMTNVTNAVVTTTVTDLSVVGFEARNLGPPRMFGGRLRYNF